MNLNENNKKFSDSEILRITFTSLMRGKLTCIERTLKIIELEDKIKTN